MIKENLKYQIAITLIPGVGDVLAKNLISYCGSAEAVFKEKKSKLEKIPDIGSVRAEAVLQNSDDALKRAEKEVEFIEKYKITPLFFTDKNYPTRLKNCDDAPVMLYYKGNAHLNESKIISIVGTREATEYGKSICKKLIEDLTKHNVIIVSGLAYGIDITAHKAALKNNLQTIGVLAHGLDRLYPSIHKSTAEKMIKQGGLLTEFLSKTNPDAENFPSRNRIVAGMSDAVIVVESGKKGGALITAEIANSYNRDVFAVPGKVGDVYSQGCNRLIKSNKAVLIESAADIEYVMGWEEKTTNGEKKNNQKKLFIELKPEEKILVDLLNENQPLDIDTLCFRSKFTMSKAASVLLNLEFSGIVKSLPGKIYQLN